ncbi:flagellar biosynthesis protein FlhF [Alteromonas flava]|uniref:flagellar biosynthesis protein FlhF n=1 Tax=Alteromonas flava TaxID=2048003 RepID=UPI000C289990|nr:flagellar biosynthesis protein FlhF [Alteromonas flava]
MKIRRFVGKDMREALRQVKDELGADAVIMSTRKTGSGIELVAAYDPHTQAPPVAAKTVKAEPPQRTPTLSEIIGDDGPDSLKQLLEKQQAANAKQTAAENRQASSNTARASANPSSYARAFKQQTEQTRKTTSTEVNHPDVAHVGVESHADVPKQLADMHQELASLRNILSFQVAALTEQRKQLKNPLHGYLFDQLQLMGIDESLSDQLINYLPSEANEREAWLMLLKLLANRVHIGGQNLLSQSGVIAMVGPTGVGKTTTIAKLAARYAQKHGADQVALVTIDSYRIGAFEQLSTYGKIIGCTVKKAHTGEELANVIHQLRNKSMVLIDTAGFSQRDARLIGQLQELSRGINMPVNYYLVAQANAQYASLQGVVNAYKNVSLQGCIFTKLDECYSLGEMLSVAINYNLPLSFVTDGQKVPEDIASASGKNLISLAARLYKKYKLHHTSNHIAANTAKAV